MPKDSPVGFSFYGLAQKDEQIKNPDSECDVYVYTNQDMPHESLYIPYAKGVKLGSDQHIDNLNVSYRVYNMVILYHSKIEGGIIYLTPTDNSNPFYRICIHINLNNTHLPKCIIIAYDDYNRPIQVEKICYEDKQEFTKHKSLLSYIRKDNHIILDKYSVL